MSIDFSDTNRLLDEIQKLINHLINIDKRKNKINNIMKKIKKEKNPLCPHCELPLLNRPLGRKVHYGGFTTATMEDLWCPKCNYSTQYKETKVKYGRFI